MNNNVKLAIGATIILFCALLLQATFLNFIAIDGIKPDLTLMIIIFLGFRKGSITGQVSGFFTGLFEDFISLSPLGFSSLVKTSIGFIYGLVEGGFVIDMVVVPVIFLAVGTIIKGILSWVFILIFSLPAGGVSIFSLKFFIEIIYNMVTAPFIFAFLRLFKILRGSDKEKA
jgi:rod shape-determining protein MreD